MATLSEYIIAKVAGNHRSEDFAEGKDWECQCRFCREVKRLIQIQEPSKLPELLTPITLIQK